MVAQQQRPSSSQINNRMTHSNYYATHTTHGTNAAAVHAHSQAQAQAQRRRGVATAPHSARTATRTRSRVATQNPNDIHYDQSHIHMKDSYFGGAPYSQGFAPSMSQGGSMPAAAATAQGMPNTMANYDTNASRGMYMQSRDNVNNMKSMKNMKNMKNMRSMKSMNNMGNMRAGMNGRNNNMNSMGNMSATNMNDPMNNMNNPNHMNPAMYPSY